MGADNFSEARDRFDVMNKVVERLTDAQLASIINGNYQNDQLYRSVYLGNRYRLVNFLERAPGKEFLIQGRE